jgi:hypothetical protein
MRGSTTQAERQLIMLSAGTATRRLQGAEQAAGLLSKVDWLSLEEALRHRKLLTVLGPRILELSEGREEEAAFRVAVERAIEAARRHGGFLQLVALRAIAMLAEEGIRASALKGPTFAEAIYRDPGRRLSNDVDLLVPPDRLRAAVEVMRRLGYAAPTDHLRKDGLPLLHLQLVHEQGKLPPIELHWRVHWYERSFAEERLLPPTPDPSGAWRPAPADELAALLLFYARDGFVDLRLASDISAWWDVYGSELPPQALERPLEAHPALQRVIRGAARAAEKVVGLPLGRLLRMPGKPDFRERLAVRLVNPNPRSSRSQLYADMGLIDGLLAPPGGFKAFVRRQLLPPREVLDQQARHGSRQRARSRLTRGVGVLGRYGLRMVSLLRAPEALR